MQSKSSNTKLPNLSKMSLSKVLRLKSGKLDISEGIILTEVDKPSRAVAGSEGS